MTGHSSAHDFEARLERIRQGVILQSPDELEARRTQREAEEHRRRVAELRSGWNAPIRHQRISPQRSGPWGERLELVSSKLGSGILMAFIGNRGAGKTQLGLELMRKTTEELRPALFRTAMELLMLLKASYRSGAGETELEVLRTHRKPALLVIDEIGRRGETSWENNMLFELLNQRYADMTDTVLTCNLPLRDFEASLGPSILSRMHEGGGIIECDWPSFRPS